MIGRKDEKGLPAVEEINAFLGRGTTFEGKITFEGMFRVDGSFNGEISAGDALVVGETAEVDGQINVNSLTVHGTVSGNITAKKRIAIYSPGKILGDIQTPMLVISEGAIFEGNCQMAKEEAMGDQKVAVLEPKEDAKGETGVKEK